MCFLYCKCVCVRYSVLFVFVFIFLFNVIIGLPELEIERSLLILCVKPCICVHVHKTNIPLCYNHVIREIKWCLFKIHFERDLLDTHWDQLVIQTSFTSF